MGQKIDTDVQRFRKLVRGKVKSNLSKYISRGEMIGKKGNDLVSIPMPAINPPQFRYGPKGSGGGGAGDGDPGPVAGAAFGAEEGVPLGDDAGRTGARRQGEGQRHRTEHEAATIAIHGYQSLMGPLVRPRGRSSK